MAALSTVIALAGAACRDAGRSEGSAETAAVDGGGFDFDTPRVGWSHLHAGIRAEIEAHWRPLDLVVLHSTGFGEAATFEDLDDYHRRVRGKEHGLAYHFVIGNGCGMRDGELRATERWRQGLPGAALRDVENAEGALAVALAGEFTDEAPTRAQLEALDELLDYLAAKAGTLRVRLHSEVESTARPCPGDQFPLDALRRAFPR